MTQAVARPRLLLGSCPDSWGVWFADDPKQTPWQRFLDELAGVGYEWLELGPYGYLPTDPVQLRDEVDKRALRVSGQTLYAPLQHADQWPEIHDRAHETARLVRAVDGRYIIVLPSYYRDERTAQNLEPPSLDDEGWRTLVQGNNELGKMLSEEYGLRLVFHPHADTHVENQEQVERFLADTDPRFVALCLDTGHFAYRHGDNAGLIHRYPDRIGYVHIKGVNPDVLKTVDEEDLPFGEAVKRGVMAEPPHAEPKIEPIAEALSELDVDEMFVIVEQDLYPCDFDVPKPIAQRTYHYLRSVGIGI